MNWAFKNRKLGNLISVSFWVQIKLIAQIVLLKLFLHRFWVSVLPLSGVSTACASLLDLLLGMVSIPGFENRYILISNVPPETRFVSTMPM